MNLITKALTYVADKLEQFGTKAATFATQATQWAGRFVGYSFDAGYNKGLAGNSLVYACIDARASAFASVMPQMRALDKAGKGEIMPDHPLALLLESPNPFMTWEELAYITEVYKCVAGECYWWLAKDNTGEPFQIWPLRPDFIVPQRRVGRKGYIGATLEIDYYDYHEDGYYYQIPPADVVHMRRGVDPIDPRRGLSPLAAILAEIGLDASATSHVSAILNNWAVPALHVKVKRKIMNEAQALEIKRAMMHSYGGPGRGEPMVSDADTEVTALNVTPQQLELPDLRDIAESRICAAFNVPPIVVGAHVGLKHGTYSNYEQAREAFWDECIGAILREARGKIRSDLVRPYWAGTGVFDWNYDDVRALQEDQEKKRRFHLDEFAKGAITRNEYLEATGREKVKDGDYYLIPNSVKERKEGEFPDPLPMPANPGMPKLPAPTPIRQLPATGTSPKA